MKTMLFFAATILVSQMTFAQTPDEVISNFESSRNVSCQFTRSSDMQFCFNTMCENKEYYKCGDNTLVLNVRSVKYPDGSMSENVTSYSVGGF
jgi:hypothetical protein